MKTTQLIEFFATNPFTDDQGYNLLIADMFETMTEDEVAKQQKMLAYFMYKVQAVLFPVIKQLASELPDQCVPDEVLRDENSSG